MRLQVSKHFRYCETVNALLFDTLLDALDDSNIICNSLGGLLYYIRFQSFSIVLH